jgi:heme a synthase
MNAPELYDFTPLLHFALTALLIAIAPLAWVWSRNRGAPAGQRLRALTALTLFLTFDLVMFGAFTRLTDSGLGCPDWPGCYGHATPVGAHSQIDAAQRTMPTGPVTHSKAWIEMIHRYLAAAVGVLILVGAAGAWASARRRESAAAAWWASATLVWVCLQGAFGALTVTMKLYPAIVTLHLIGGMVLLALLAAQLPPAAAERFVDGRLRRATIVVLILVGVQTALGGWVSTNYAVMACTDFPTCQGSWWPPMNFGEGFQLRRELGVSAAGGFIPFEALTAIHYVHRLAAYVVLLALGAFAWALYSSRETGLRPWGVGVAALAGWQLASGLSNVLLDWPLLGAVAHTGGAAGLVTMLTLLLMRTTSEPRPAASALDPGATRAPARPTS